MPPIESLAETAEETAQFEAMMNDQPPPEQKVEEQPVEQKTEQKVEEQPKQEEAPKEQPKEEKPVRLVPHQALHEERERRKALETRLAELEKAAQKTQPPPNEEPDEQQDPIGSIAWLKAELKREREEKAQAQAQHEYIQDLGRKVKTRIDAYAAEHPEYKEQVDFLRNFRFRELTEGLGYPAEMAVQQVQQEEVALGKMAIDQDLDPGAMVAKLASVRGWKAKEEEKSAPKAAPEGVKEAEAKIDRIARGQKAAISPSGAGGGGAADEEMTLEKLLSLKGKAFDDAFEKHGRRLMGG